MKLFPFEPPHEIMVIRSPSTIKLDKPKAFANTRPFYSTTTSTSIAKPSFAGLEYALITKPHCCVISQPIPSCFRVPKEYPSKFNLRALSLAMNHTCEVFLTILLGLDTRLKGVPLKALMVEAKRG